MSSAVMNKAQQAPAATHSGWAGALLPPGWRRAETHLVLDSRGLWHGAERHQDLASWAQAARDRGARLPRRLRLHLSGELLHEWPCDPALPLANDDERLAWAQRLQEQYHGPDAARWPLAVWNGRGHGVCSWAQPIAAGPQRESRTGSKAHAAVRQWRDEARRLGFQCASIMPLWRAGLLAARQQVPAYSRLPEYTLLFVEASQVTVITLARGKPSQVLRRRLPAATLASLRQFVAALPPRQRACCVALGAGLALTPDEVRKPEQLLELGDLGQALPWSCPPGVDHSSRSTAVTGPDFCRPVRQGRPWPWLAAAAGLAMAGVTGYETLQLQQALAQARASAAPPALAAQASTGPAHPRSAWLQTPWPAVIQGLEHATAEGVRWDGLQADVQGRLWAQGQAESESAARAVAQRLRDHGAWKQVNLARSEAGPEAWRFEVQGRLADAAPGPGSPAPGAGTARGGIQP